MTNPSPDAAAVEGAEKGVEKMTIDGGEEAAAAAEGAKKGENPPAEAAPAPAPAPAAAAAAAAQGGGGGGGSKKKKKKKKGGGGGGGGGDSSQQSQSKPKAPEREWTPDLQEDLDRILAVGEECISEGELRGLLAARGRGSGGPGFNLYDGFEPSGRMHIAQGVFKAMNVNKCTHPGTNSTFVFWVADWFALMNDKMGGDLSKIRTVGQYLIEVWKAAGMDLSHVVFKWASEEITDNAVVYWPKMLDVARKFNITRIKKCCQIMGRLEGSLTSAQVLYPLMQCTDVFFLRADVCQLGVDQRKVNMLAREYCDAAGIKRKPVILSHHMLYGLKAGQEKMSKSDPDSAVFMEDTAEDVERKIMAAYCPSKEEEPAPAEAAEAADAGEAKAEEAAEQDAGKESMHLTVDKLKNPCLDYIQHIILSPPGATFTTGGKTYTDFAEIKAAFLAGEMTEAELKRGLIDELNKLLEPVRTHFAENERAKGLLEQVRQFKKESSTPSAEKEVRRLNLIKLGKVPAGCHATFAPLPSARPTLKEALDTLARLKLGGKGGEPAKPTVLFLPDWSARVMNACDADVKAIDAYYAVLTTALRSLDPTAMEGVVVLRQSDAILADPSNYWISVINVGRHFALDDVTGPGTKDSDGVGVVVSRLMKVADVMGLEPASVAFSAEGDDAEAESGLVGRYFDEKLGGVARPEMPRGDGPAATLQRREDDAHRTDNDEYYVLDDPKQHGKAKMKKAFCEPGNAEFCPPIDLAAAFGFEEAKEGKGEIEIKRSEENGGDVAYRSREEMVRDFASGALHPGDLKAAASAIMVGVLEKLSRGIKQDPEATKAAKALKAFDKKMSKKKK